MSRKPTARSVRAALDNLRASRALLEGRGKWAQGVMKERRPRTLLAADDFRYCSMGAIREADGPGEKPAVGLLARAIDAIRGPRPTRTTWDKNYTEMIQVPVDDSSRIVQFNDGSRTTKAQVLAAFDRAIAIAEDELAALEAGS